MNYQISYQKILAISSLLLALAVILGAFGAHALATRLSAYQLDIWQKANFYHFIHALALFCISILVPLNLLIPATYKVVALAMLIGIVIFSGSLYALALTNIKILGAITPFGGLSFILGWLYLGITLLKAKT